MKYFTINTERLHDDALDAAVAQTLRNQPTRRLHKIEARIELAQIRIRRTPDQVSEATGEHARQVRMRKRDARRATGLRCVERGPGQMIGIADFDHVGLQHFEDSTPASRPQWRSISSPQWNPHARKREHARFGFTTVRTWYEQTVTHTRVRRVVAMFGREVALHPTAMRGEEQGDIGDMHLS